MKILEFDLPSFIMPSEPYWIHDCKLIIVPTAIPLPKTDYWSPITATKVILYDADNECVKSLLRDIVIFSNFLNNNHPLLSWFSEKSFADLSIYEKNIVELEGYVNKISERQDWYLTVDFDKYPLSEMSPHPSIINFRDNFLLYRRLSQEEPNELKQLIDFFAYNYLTGILLNKIYNNSNLQVSNSFIIIESLINQEITNQSGFEICPECQYKIPKKKKMVQLIEEYVNLKIEDEEIQAILISILKEHYRIRNNFFHNAKFDSINDRINKMIKKLGRSRFTLADEIMHAGASQMGLWFINIFIRLELLNKLKKSF